MSLHEKALALLKKRLGEGWSLRGLIIKSGEIVTYEWSKKLLDGTIKDPSVNKVEALYAYLKRVGKPSK